MLTKISSLFLNKTKIWKVMLFLVLIILMFSIMPFFNFTSGNIDNMTSLDHREIYTFDELYSIISLWGEEGRYHQIIFHLTWDLAFPIIYFFFIGFLISILTKIAFDKLSKWHYLNLLSMIALFDLFENISIILLVIKYSQKSELLFLTKTVSTIIKYYIFGPCLILSIIIPIMSIIKNNLFEQR